MTANELSLLRQALSGPFGEHDSDCLARLLILCLDKEMTAYSELDISCPDRDDHILTLFEERVLIPVQCVSGSTWEEKSLRLHPEESYFLPPVARSLISYAVWTGLLDTEQALTGVLAMCPAVDTQSLVRLVTRCLEQTTSHRLEAGLMGAVAHRLGLSLDLHQAVDLFWACGILSPCKGVSQATGLSWYEMNPCLFWQSRHTQ